MDHRSRECTCAACTALGKVASVVVDEATTEPLRTYVAKVLEKAYTRILEKGLELLQREHRAGGGEESGAGCHPAPGVEVENKEVKSEAEEEAPKKRKRRKRRTATTPEIATEEKDEQERDTQDHQLPKPETAEDTAEEKRIVEDKKVTLAPVVTPAVEGAGSSSRKPTTPEQGTEGKKPIGEQDPRLPLPRKVAKPSAKPPEPLKEKKSREGSTGKSGASRPLNLRPKAKVERKRSTSRSRERDQKDKKKRRSTSPYLDSPGGGREVSSFGREGEGEGATLIEAPPGNWEDCSLRTRRPKSPDHPPPLPRRPTRGQLWIGPIRAYKNRPVTKKKNKRLKKELKNERYWERRRQRLWEERTRGYRRR